MTLKTFRDAYLATRFLSVHVPGCRLCGRDETAPCPDAFDAVQAVVKADQLLDIPRPRGPEARITAWRNRSLSRR